MYSGVKFHTVDLSKHSFLVTGGAGFIGSHIVEYLMEHGAGRVVVLDDLSTGSANNIKPFLSKDNFQFIGGDIVDYAKWPHALEGVEFVFHQAALGSVQRSIEYPLLTNEVNVSGFLTMLNASKKMGIKRVVYASSSSVYGDNDDTTKEESRIGEPLSAYAATKQINEIYANVFAKTYGMEIVGLRYFNVYGERQNSKGAYAAVIPIFIDAMLNDKPIFINGNGRQSRDFTHVENVVQGNIKAMFCDMKRLQRVYNIACCSSYSINYIFEKIRELIGSNVVAEYRDKRPGDIENSFARIANARLDLGYEPQVLLEDGLARVVKWFKQGR